MSYVIVNFLRTTLRLVRPDLNEGFFVFYLLTTLNKVAYYVLIISQHSYNLLKTFIVCECVYVVVCFCEGPAQVAIILFISI